MDLTLATTDQLIDELALRYPNLLVAGVRPSEGRVDGDSEECLILWRGGLTTALGLANRSAAIIKRECLPEDDE